MTDSGEGSMQNGAAIARLSVEVSNLQGQVSSITTKLDSFVTSVQTQLNSRQPPLTTIITLMFGTFIFLSSFVVVFTNPLNSGLVKLTEKVEQDRKELADNIKYAREERIQHLHELRKETVERDKNIVDTMAEMRNLLVPRAEHTQYWAGQAKQDTYLQSQIDSINGKIDSFGNVGTIVNDLKREIQDLNKAVYENTKNINARSTP